MLRLRGDHNGMAYQIEISKDPKSSDIYQCRITGGNGFEKRLTVEVLSRVGSRWTLSVDGKIEDLVISRPDAELLIDWKNRNYRLSVANPKDSRDVAHSGHGRDQNLIRAEMTGKVVSVERKAGDPVAAGESVATIEAMKMLNQVKAPKAGTIRKAHIEPGSVVKPGDLLFEIE